jgi:hypothetical protein
MPGLYSNAGAKMDINSSTLAGGDDEALYGLKFDPERRGKSKEEAWNGRIIRF